MLSSVYQSNMHIMSGNHGKEGKNDDNAKESERDLFQAPCGPFGGTTSIDAYTALKEEMLPISGHRLGG